MVTMAPQIRISQELYKHLKTLGGTMSKNLDKIVLGRETKPIERKKKRKLPESSILYTSILSAFNPIEPKPISRREILEHVNEDLKDSQSAKDYPQWFDYETNLNWRSKFSMTIDNRLFALVRSNRLRREDGLFYLVRK